MNLVHVISSLDPRCGGPTTALVALVRAQIEAGHHVTVVATWSKSQEPAAAEQLMNLGADVRLVGPTIGPMMWHWRITPTLREAITGADLVHIHAVWEEIQHRAAVLARRSNVPYVITTHGMLDPWSLGQRSLKKRAYLLLRLRRDLDHAAAVHFTTDIERDLVAPLRLKSPSIVEPYCLDLSEFDCLPVPGRFRAKYPHIAGRKIVLFFGRVHPKKGLDLLIPAFAKANAPQTVLVLAGPVAPEYRAELEALIARHDLRDRVIRTGMLYNGSRIEALADADLFVLPSYQENFGIAVVEALAAGCPVVISDQVNIHRHITRAHLGAVVPTQVDALAAQLARWLRDDTDRADASRRARAFALRRFDLARAQRRWGKHYARLIGDHRARTVPLNDAGRADLGSSCTGHGESALADGRGSYSASMLLAGSRAPL